MWKTLSILNSWKYVMSSLTKIQMNIFFLLFDSPAAICVKTWRNSIRSRCVADFESLDFVRYTDERRWIHVVFLVKMKLAKFRFIPSSNISFWVCCERKINIKSGHLNFQLWLKSEILNWTRFESVSEQIFVASFKLSKLEVLLLFF